MNQLEDLFKVKDLLGIIAGGQQSKGSTIADVLKEVSMMPGLSEAMEALKPSEEPKDSGYIAIVSNPAIDLLAIIYKGNSRKRAEELVKSELRANPDTVGKVIAYTHERLEDSYTVTLPKVQLMLLSRYNAVGILEDAQVMPEGDDLLHVIRNLNGPVFSQLPGWVEKERSVPKDSVDFKGTYYYLENLK